MYCQENESAWHQNRYILITVSPRINFKVVHYEYINGYLELHLEDDYYGNTFNQRLYKYLRDNIDTESGDYLWHNWNGMKQGRLRYEYKIGDLLELADYLTKFISKIDPLIEDFLNTYYDGNNDTQKEILQYHLLILIKLKMVLLSTLILQMELEAKLSFIRCH